MGVQLGREEGSKLEAARGPFFKFGEETEKGRQFCSSKSSYSYYVESVIEELKSENFSVPSASHLNRGHLTLGTDAFLVF
jgi:hypothetical protein